MRRILSFSLILSSAIIGCTIQTPEDQTKQSEVKSPPGIEENEEPRITGVGGIFFKADDPKKMKTWYKNKLGLNTDQWGTNFEWYQGRDSTKKGFTQWSPFGSKTSFFEPSTKDYMINYRVVHLEKMLQQLESKGVNILDSIAHTDYGKFVHILDVEGNKVELWEPIDTEYEKLLVGRTK